MKDSFKVSKQIAEIMCIFFACIFFLFLITNYIKDNTLTRKAEILAYKPKLEILRGKTINYRVDLYFVSDVNSKFTISDIGMKYLDYKNLMNDIDAYDSVTVEFNKNNCIYSLSKKGKNYLDKNKILIWEHQNRNIFLFVLASLCLSTLPILFFKQQPVFLHSGFEFEFSFRVLFIFTVLVSNIIFINHVGWEYI